MRAARPNATDQHDEVHDLQTKNIQPYARRVATGSRSLQLGQNVAEPQRFICQHRNPEYVHREKGFHEATNDRQYNENEYE